MQRIGHGAAQYRVLLVCGLCFMSDSIEVGLLAFLQVKAGRSQNINQNGATSGFEMCFAIGSQHGAPIGAGGPNQNTFLLQHKEMYTPCDL